MRFKLSLLFINLLFFFFFLPQNASSQEPLKVIILPFDVHSLEDISDVRLKVLERLAKEIDKAPEIRVRDGETLKQIVKSRGKEIFNEEEALDIGRHEGVEFIIIGSITKIGKNLSLDIKILNVPLKRLSALAFVEDDDPQKLLAKLSSLSVETRKSILREAISLGRVFVKEANIIGKISIVGNKRIDSDAILARISSKSGETFSREQIREDVRAIYNMGFFSDILVDLADTAIGKEITFIVKEKPQVKEVEISGNKNITTEKILEVITIKPNNILKRVAIQQDIERIKSLYATKGFYLAEVDHSIEQIGDQAIITFHIKEGAKVKVKRITFIGNEVFTDKELKKVMRTKESSLFSFITKSGFFDNLVFDNDLNLILGKYFDNGYIQAEIVSSQIQVSKDRRWLFITVSVEEGDQFRVGKIDLAGDLVRTRMELLEKIKITSGEVFRRSILGKDIATLTDIYADEGYAFVDVRPVTKVDKDNKMVDVTFNISKNNKVIIDRIDITGNIKTRDKVIRREIELAEGELYSSTKLRRSRRNLSRLGYFDDVDITSQPGETPNTMILKVDVDERPTGSFAIGAGYSSVDAFIASVSISQNNLFGTGRKLSVDGTFSSSSQRYDISFTEPWLLDHPISAGFDLFRIDKDFPDFSRFSNGGDVRLGFQVFKDTRYFFTYKLEEVEVKDISSNAGLFIKEQEGRRVESSITNVIRRDTRNSFLDPTEGSVESLSIEFSGGILGGDTNFVKYIARAGKYFPMPFDTTLLIKGELGFVHPFNNDTVPIYERFFLGGINSIRGFKTRSLGPKDPGTGEVIGGDKEIFLNLEYIFPLHKEQRVKGVVFIDTGNAYDEGEFDVGDLRTGAGLGIRWFSPFGLLRLEWGFNFDRKEGEESSQFEFSVGGSL